MFRALIERILIERELSDAWRHVNGLLPFSPAWDAAMAEVEDLERDLWRLKMGLRTPETPVQSEPQPASAS